jgi:pimeloyl-ACP methyl ester carboxylesterase
MQQSCVHSRQWLSACLLVMGIVSGIASSLFACDRTMKPKQQGRKSFLPAGNLVMKTLGGRQFWGDVLFFHDWRIQQNVLTKKYRLLDGKDYRHADGSLEECKAALEQIKKDQILPPMSGKAVVVVHGIFRSSKSFRKMRTHLLEEDYQVFGFEYPSTRVSISDSAEHLRQSIESLKGIEEINFVVHSMGGLVVRSYLVGNQDKRIKRMVMMGVPNLGARMADRVIKIPLYHTLFGPAGKQLLTGDDGIAGKLPIPEFEFAVIAGSKGDSNGFNPFIPGDDDGTVSVSNTRLPGATDFIAIRALHSFMMFDDDVIGSTMRFLKTGRLRETGELHPIPRLKEKTSN